MAVVARSGLALLVVALVVAGCGAPPGPGSQVGGAESQRSSTGMKRFTAAVLKPDLTSLRPSVDSGSNRVVELIHAGLARTDERSGLHPQLAEEVPTLENNLWQVLADGRMSMTWRIRADARWHDGSHSTSGDFVFSAEGEQDREIAWRRDAGWAAVEGVEAPDPRTFVIRWSTPYIEADAMAASSERLLPEHLLERTYRENKAGLLEHPYWTNQWVGAGPFRLRELVQGSHLLLEAYDEYVLGRPKVAEIEVKLIPASATLVANILAGAVDLTLGLTLAPDEAANLRAQWRDGKVITSPYFGSTVAVFPKLRSPSPAIVLDVRFRRALLYAVDRQEMVDTILVGQSAIPHSIAAVPTVPQEEFQASVVRYDYDPRQAARLLEEVGYQRGPGGVYEDASGQRLSLDIWAIQEEQERVKGMLSVADYWKRAGIDAQPVVVPPTQANAELLTTFPAFIVRGGAGGGISAIQRYYHGIGIPSAQTRFSGNHHAQYSSPELDALIDRLMVAIPRGERIEALRLVLRHMTDQVVGMGLFYNVDNAMVGNRLVDVTPSNHVSRGWNAHLWDVR